MSAGGYGFGNHPNDNAPLMSNAGYGPQGGHPQQDYPPQGSQYSAPPTNYQQPYQENGSIAGAGDTFQSMAANGNMNDVFFAAACSLIVGAFVSGVIFLFEFKMVDFIGLTYLTVFGVALAVLDAPILKGVKGVVDAKMYIGKYIHLFTRVTGKGVAFVFLGSMLFMTMWDNIEGGFVQFLSVVLCFFPIIVGIGAIAIGVLKSKKLDKARRQLQHVIDQRYDQFAQTYRGPNGGLTMHEFNMLTLENGGFRFQSLDLKLIFNALVSNPTWRMQAASNAKGPQGSHGAANDADIKIPKADLKAWCDGGFVLL